ncbi:hypothetical protein BD0134_07430 [Helicobacter pylori]
MGPTSLFLFKLNYNRTEYIKSKKKKELKFLKKPQFVAEFVPKDKRALHKASGNLLKMRSLERV